MLQKLKAKFNAFSLELYEGYGREPSIYETKESILSLAISFPILMYLGFGFFNGLIAHGISLILVSFVVKAIKRHGLNLKCSRIEAWVSIMKLFN